MGDLKILEPMESKWQIAPFVDEQVLVFLPTRPSLWYRIWMRIFLGWKFKKIIKE